MKPILRESMNLLSPIEKKKVWRTYTKVCYDLNRFRYLPSYAFYDTSTLDLVIGTWKERLKHKNLSIQAGSILKRAVTEKVKDVKSRIDSLTNYKFRFIVDKTDDKWGVLVYDQQHKIVCEELVDNISLGYDKQFVRGFPYSTTVVKQSGFMSYTMRWNIRTYSDGTKTFEA